MTIYRIYTIYYSLYNFLLGDVETVLICLNLGKKKDTNNLHYSVRFDGISVLLISSWCYAGVEEA